MATTMGMLLREAVDSWGPRISVRRRREALQWSVLSWAELGEQVRAIAAGLLGLGVERGDGVALLCGTRIEWSLVDYASLSIGASVVPLYHSNTPAQWRFIIQDSGASVLVVEDREQLEALVPLLDSLPDLKHVVLIEVADLREVERSVLLDELGRDGRRLLRAEPSRLDEAIDAVQPEDLATVVYTSGTTGQPKGVKLTHANLLAAVHALDSVIPVGPEDTTVLCLPLSHIYPRLAQFTSLATGFCIAYARRIDRLQEVLIEVKPTFFFAVPRIYERIYHETLARYRELPPLLQVAFRKGVAAARDVRGLPRPEAGPPATERPLLSRLGFAKKLQERAADKAIFEPVREALGGRIRFCLSGGAPMNVEVLRFFELAGVEVLEGYGLTETVGAGTINPPGEARIGTVGRPLPGVRVRIAADGEILLHGAPVFGGYHDQPDETELALDDGWLHTGDLGRFDEAGYLIITDRKKDLIILSGAKNVPPQRVEGALRLSSYISEAMIFGDRRPYLVALFALDEAEVRRFASKLGIEDKDWSALVREPRILRLMEEEVERCNSRLARFEQVRRFRILPRSLSIQGGELTPTLKVRRTAVQERYRPLIEAMYAELPAA
ncbi:MAG: long-chain fatty acid--CoA ligase [Deltaproteobacteria bacterium]|nr:long-chain fatty acid--CoA ligase [Deltaproteobacteria bacterium]